MTSSISFAYMIADRFDTFLVLAGYSILLEVLGLDWRGVSAIDLSWFNLTIIWELRGKGERGFVVRWESAEPFNKHRN
ncbi:hypothetical protein V8C44DRAFT_326849 [Trichoderma aethiopicum]